MNGPVEGAYTPLMAAVRGQHTALTAVLLEHGAPPNDARYKSTTLLMTAAKNRDFATLKWAQVPPATPEDKAEILAMFQERLPQAPPRPASSPILRVTPSGSRP